MDRAAKAEGGKDLEALEHRAVARAGQVAGGVAEEELEADGAGRSQRLELVEIVLAEEAVEAEIDIGLGSASARFASRLATESRRRDRVRHVEDGGDAADRRRGVPVCQSSLCSMPGSRKWTWTSIPPGST